MNPKYQNILYMEHHQSSTHKHMSIEERAAQFSPFAALVGYDDQIEDTNRFRQEKVELSDSALEELNEKMNTILMHIKENPMVEILYYNEEMEQYVSKEGRIKRFLETERKLVFLDYTKIALENIYSIEIK